MLKRLIEVALPLKEVSEQSEKRQISALHLWWARRPLTVSRVIVFASLIPDPDDPHCPEHFRQLVRAELGDPQFKPKNGNGGTVDDTPRSRCLEFIKQLVKWENSNEPHYIEPAKKLIKEAHKLFDPDSDAEVPKVLDPFAGGGAIPLEALRLGCEVHAIDINPVAHLIELCTLIYPQQFGKPLPKDKPIPDYIKKLIAYNKAKGKKSKDDHPLFDSDDNKPLTENDDLIPDVEISEDGYRRSPLAADVKYWGHWVLAHAKKELQEFYPLDEDGSVPVAYLWARTVRCPNPACGATVPLVRQLWLSNKKTPKVAMRMVPDCQKMKCVFEIVEEKQIDFDPSHGTRQRGQGSCPFCQTVATSKYLQAEGHSGRLGQQLMSVVTLHPGVQGKHYRAGKERDIRAFQNAKKALEKVKQEHGNGVVPQEDLIAWSGVFNAPLFGMKRWGELFNSRQQLSLSTLCRTMVIQLSLLENNHQEDYVRAVSTYVAFLIDKHADYNATLTSWHPRNQQIRNVFNRQALPMVWDFCEVNPFSGSAGSLHSTFRDICRFPLLLSPLEKTNGCYVSQGSAPPFTNGDRRTEAAAGSDEGRPDTLRNDRLRTVLALPHCRGDGPQSQRAAYSEGLFL